jgi:uncharacterized membrane protein
MNADALVSDYLGRLEAAAWPLPPERRIELASEVREHIEAALGEAGSRDEVTVRNVLERLGRPEEIVAGEAAGSAPAASAVSVNLGPSRASVGAVEIAAILLLTLGAFLLPLIGPVIGLVFVWLSSAWSTRVKVVVTAIVIGVVIIPILGLLAVRTM